jgi:hypothetical protein
LLFHNVFWFLPGDRGVNLLKSLELSIRVLQLL